MGYGREIRPPAVLFDAEPISVRCLCEFWQNADVVDAINTITCRKTGFGVPLANM